ncbi:glutathione synthase [Aureococcus anophagefferens]|nr:glutathione synthase [Aureococcus anophagefferens]
MQPAFNRLVERVAQDAAWLEATLEQTAASDAFTRRLLELRRSQTSAQTASLGLLRSDYMIDAGPGSGDAPFENGKALQLLHAYVAAKYAGGVDDAWLRCRRRDRRARGIAAAHAEYERQYPAAAGAPPRRVAVVVQPGERNQMDQRMLEHELWDAHGVAMERVTLLEALEDGVADASGALTFRGGAWELSVAYFAGYSPDEYLAGEWARFWRTRARSTPARGRRQQPYGAELKDALETLSPSDRAAFILMDRINPPQRRATLVRDGAPVEGDCVCELGVYGTILARPADGGGAPVELHNEVVGHLLRQKLLGVDEGGVAAGFAVLVAGPRRQASAMGPDVASSRVARNEARPSR